MLLNGLGEDQDVIKVHTNNTFRDQILEDVIHHSLECGRTVGETKEHHQGLKEASVSPKGSLPLITFLHVHVIESPTDVKFGEITCTTKTVDEFRDERQRVTVLDRNSIEGTIVLYQM